MNIDTDDTGLDPATRIIYEFDNFSFAVTDVIYMPVSSMGKIIFYALRLRREIDRLETVIENLENKTG